MFDHPTSSRNMLKSDKNIFGAAFIKNLQDGDEACFNQLFEYFAAKIYNFAFSYLKDKTETEELVQIVFVKFWEKKEKLSASENVKGYLFKIAVNSLYDFIRSKKRLHVFQSILDDSIQIGSNSTWDEVVSRDLIEQYQELLKQMPEKRRLIFEMSRNEGKSHQEIATQLGISIRTVENQIHRGVAFLKSNLQANQYLLVLFVSLFVD
jgi:RNA polymerase sigma-70 factor (ECF subfamily)